MEVLADRSSSSASGRQENLVSVGVLSTVQKNLSLLLEFVTAYAFLSSTISRPLLTEELLILLGISTRLFILQGSWL